MNLQIGRSGRGGQISPAKWICNRLAPAEKSRLFLVLSPENSAAAVFRVNRIFIGHGVCEEPRSQVIVPEETLK